MELSVALARLGSDEYFAAVVEFVKSERERCLVDFQNLDMVEKPQALAYLAGEIAAFDRLLKIVDDQTS
jgi:hypothetical protein